MSTFFKLNVDDNEIMFSSIIKLVESRLCINDIISLFARTRSLLHKREMHSNPIVHNYAKMRIKVLPALSDNFMYLLIDEESREAAVVDPVDPETVIRETEYENVSLTTVLTTHHHWDHAGGNAELVDKMKSNLLVVGGDSRIAKVSKIVKDGEEFKVGTLTVRCLHTPCHTSGHMCYYVTSSLGEYPVVFTGDTLFIAGCGRFFEGTAEQMNEALNKKLSCLPDETRVYCGHEYTITNLKFAQIVEPANEDIKIKLGAATCSRKNKKPTVPSSIGDEKKINPFMRVHTKSVQNYANTNDIIQTMSFIRKQKDAFKC